MLWHLYSAWKLFLWQQLSWPIYILAFSCFVTGPPVVRAVSRGMLTYAI